MRSHPVMAGAPTISTSAKMTPVATFTPKTVDRNVASTAGRWIMAGPVPSSMNNVARPKNASAISSRPRSSGVKQVREHCRNRDEQDRGEQVLQRQPEHRGQAAGLQHVGRSIAGMSDDAAASRHDGTVNDDHHKGQHGD